MFNNVMTDLLELNIQAFDQKDNGIHAKFNEISKILLVNIGLCRLQNLNFGSIWKLLALTHFSTALGGQLSSLHNSLSSFKYCVSGRAFFPMKIGQRLLISLLSLY